MSMRLNPQSKELLGLFRKFYHSIFDVDSISYSHSKYTVPRSTPVESIGSQLFENPINSKAIKEFNKYEVVILQSYRWSILV